MEKWQGIALIVMLIGMFGSLSFQSYQETQIATVAIDAGLVQCKQIGKPLWKKECTENTKEKD